MADVGDEFTVWLNEKLKDLNTDEGVFGSYIIGILDGDESQDDKNEALDGILSEIISTDTLQLRTEIIEKWSTCRSSQLSSSQLTTTVDVDAKLAKLLESRSLDAPKQKKYTAEEKKIREAILSQYSQMTDDEDDEGAGDYQPKVPDFHENGLEKNTNAQSVAQAEKEKREQAKLDSQKKKEKDREDREKQKQLRDEKKEKRKTQKGERRR